MFHEDFNAEDILTDTYEEELSFDQLYKLNDHPLSRDNIRRYEEQKARENHYRDVCKKNAIEQRHNEEKSLYCINPYAEKYNGYTAVLGKDDFWDLIYDRHIKDYIICNNGDIITNPKYPFLSKEKLFANIRLAYKISGKRFFNENIEDRIVANGTTSKMFKVVNEKDVKTTFDFIIEGTPLVKPSLGMIQGASSSQKSLLIMSLLSTISSGIEHPIITGKVQRNKVLYLDYEQGATATFFRKNSIEKGFGIKSNYPIISSLGEDIIPQCSPENYSSIIDLIQETEADLVVVDTLIAGCSIVDENNSADIQNVMNMLKSISTKTNTCIIIIHHKGKGENSGIYGSRGSSAIPSAMDFIIDIHIDEDENKEFKKVRHFTMPKDKHFLFKDKNKNVDFQFDNVGEYTYLNIVEKEDIKESLNKKIIEYISDSTVTELKTCDNIREKVKGKNSSIRQAILNLVSLGEIEEIKKGNAKVYSIVK